MHVRGGIVRGVLVHATVCVTLSDSTGASQAVRCSIAVCVVSYGRTRLVLHKEVNPAAQAASPTIDHVQHSMFELTAGAQWTNQELHRSLQGQASLVVTKRNRRDNGCHRLGGLHVCYTQQCEASLQELGNDILCQYDSSCVCVVEYMHVHVCLP